MEEALRVIWGPLGPKECICLRSMVPSIFDRPREEQKKGQEHYGTLKQLGMVPLLTLFAFAWYSWPSIWLFPGRPVNSSHYLVLVSDVGDGSKPLEAGELEAWLMKIVAMCR